MKQLIRKLMSMSCTMKGHGHLEFCTHGEVTQIICESCGWYIVQLCGATLEEAYYTKEETKRIAEAMRSDKKSGFTYS